MILLVVGGEGDGESSVYVEEASYLFLLVSMFMPASAALGLSGLS